MKFLKQLLFWYFIFLGFNSEGMVYLPADSVEPEFQYQTLKIPNHPDSSIYTSIEKESGVYWFAGENGIFLEVNARKSDVELSNSIQFQGKGFDVYDLKNLSADKIIATGKSGSYWIYTKSTKQWETHQIKGYSKNCLYRVTVISPDTFFICGGRNGIVHSRKMVPFGFIIITTDGGNTFKTIWHSWRFFVFDLFTPNTDTIMAMAYTPKKSKCLTITNLYHVHALWTAKKSLIHSFAKYENSTFAYGLNGQKGVLVSSTNGAQLIQTESGFKPWFAVPSENHSVLIIGSGGSMKYIKNNQIQSYSLPYYYSLYTAVHFNTNSWIIGGSNSGLYLITLKAK